VSRTEERFKGARGRLSLGAYGGGGAAELEVVGPVRLQHHTRALNATRPPRIS
jgi:hypothetical protein